MCRCALADRLEVSRQTIRRIFSVAGEPARSAGRPRLAASSETIAELYEAGVSFDEISTRLGIHPDAARTRWDEIRSRRGLTRRGLWHRVLLAALLVEETVAVLPTAAAHLGRTPTTSSCPE